MYTYLPLPSEPYESINPAPGGTESSSLPPTGVIPVRRVLAAGVGTTHLSRPGCTGGEVRQGPSSAGYSAEPVPRVTGEDLNGCEGGSGSHWYGGAGGRGKTPSTNCPYILRPRLRWSCSVRQDTAKGMAAEKTTIWSNGGSYTTPGVILS